LFFWGSISSLWLSISENLLVKAETSCFCFEFSLINFIFCSKKSNWKYDLLNSSSCSSFNASIFFTSLSEDDLY
jgi:hypothetical protein